MKLSYWGMGWEGVASKRNYSLHVAMWCWHLVFVLTVIPIFLLQWVSAVEPLALTFTLEDHKMATFTVSYSTSEKTELLHQKERTWSWRGVREEITTHSSKRRTNAEIVKSNKQTNKPRRQQRRSGNFCDCTILETVIRFTAQWWICYFFVYYKMCIQVTCFTLCQISIF